MGQAKELMFELQEERAVASALNITPEALRGHDYEIREGGFRGHVVWSSTAPDGIVTEDLDGELATEIDMADLIAPDDSE